jgi:hypothetical protein
LYSQIYHYQHFCRNTYVQTFEFDNDNNAIAEEKFVLFAFTSKNWVNEYGTHYDKVMWHLFTREQWLDLMTNYVMLASGFDNKNEIKDILVDGKVTNTALKGKNRKENINFISMSGDLYLTKDFNEKFKIVYNERSFGLFLKESNNLVQLSRNDLIKIHNNFFIIIVGIYKTIEITVMKKEFKVEIIKEGALGTILFGSSKLPLNKMTEVMNKYGDDGWDVSFQLIEKHRLLFLWSREAIIITFSRDKN